MLLKKNDLSQTTQDVHLARLEELTVLVSEETTKLVQATKEALAATRKLEIATRKFEEASDKAEMKMRRRTGW